MKELEELISQINFAHEISEYYKKQYNMNGAYHYKMMEMYYTLKYQCRVSASTKYWIP